MVNRTFTTVSGSEIHVANNLNLVNGMVHGQTAINLGATATITGETNGRYVTGKIQTIRTVNNSTETFGGLGLTLNATGENLGSTTLLREAGTGPRD